MTLKIVVYESDPGVVNACKRLTSDYEVHFVEGLLTDSNVDSHTGAHIITTDQSVLNPDILRRFYRLQLIAVRSSGFDHINLACCKDMGITVCNVPGYAANAVAEHTFALMLAISRHLEAAIQCTRKAKFSWEGLQGFELRGKTVAVIGTGAIGKRVAEIARGFNMNVLAVDLTPDESWAAALAIRYVDFETAISTADLISLNIPALSGKNHLLNETHFQRMKTGVIIINTARGELIDNEALVRALDTGKVAAAGLDVLPDEHFIREKDKDPGIFFEGVFDSKTMLANHLLFQHPNTIITPHIGWFSTEADQRALDVTVENIEKFLAGKPENVVSL
jgi:D-lactate dehydrogenase